MKEAQLIEPDIQLSNHIVKEVISELSAQDIRAGVMESEGIISDKFTVEGSTAVFNMGLVTPNAQMRKAYGLEDIAHEYGEDSPELAVAMASHVCAYQDSIKPFPLRSRWGIGIASSSDSNQVSFAVVSKDIGSDTQRLLAQQTFFVPQHLDPLKRQEFISQQVFSHLLSTSKGRKLDTYTPQILITNESPAIQRLSEISNEVVRLAHALGLPLVVNESATGGSLVQSLIRAAKQQEIDDVVVGGVVSYNEDAKMKEGLDGSLLRYGRVYSQDVALGMANAAYNKYLNGKGIAIGITGTTNNKDTRPFHEDTEAGTVHMGFNINGIEVADTFNVRSQLPDGKLKNRERIKLQEDYQVLFELKKILRRLAIDTTDFSVEELGPNYSFFLDNDTGFVETQLTQEEIETLSKQSPHAIELHKPLVKQGERWRWGLRNLQKHTFASIIRLYTLALNDDEKRKNNIDVDIAAIRYITDFMPNFRQLAASEILAPKAEWFADPQHKDSIHGIAHMTRVAFYAQILGQYFGLNQKEMEIVLKSAITHDTQRVNDRWDEGHGDRAGIWFKTSDTAEELREDMSDEDIEAVAELNKYHETRLDQIPAEVQEKYGKLLKVIRLADAFDRFRSPHMVWWPKKEFLPIEDQVFLQNMYNFACYFSIVSEYERFLYELDEREAIISFGRRVKAVKDAIESTVIFEEKREEENREPVLAD